MQFNLEVHLIIEDVGLSARGKFSARNKKEIPNVAHQYIRSIKRETGYRRTLIEGVMVNGTVDITEAVKEIENQPIPPMDDIFW
ncbi:hypothetical protein FB550_12063 [Neobacillus bataviensis]|uniref:Uncharacterized protein n=1 Tax=Neobacillus bataviensis TaxID=220685 RepID=A0A561CLY6_9BACI|nr:hypothetical protein [Neobacillus bataviensis]TWD92251.1 hypothetical protein FB550_12063 [Neobacillus bataviensis]